MVLSNLLIKPRKNLAVRPLVITALASLLFLHFDRVWISFWLFSLIVGILLSHYLTPFRFKPSQIGTALAISFLIMLAGSPASAGSGSGTGGLFGPMEDATQDVLNAAGAGDISSQTTGIFGMLNIIAGLVAIGALVYGIFEQRNGNTMRESFMPFLMVLLLYVGAQFVMSIFLSGTSA